MKLAIATCAKFAQLEDSDQALIPLFAQRGISASPVVWDDTDTAWQNYDAVLIRSIWDYHLNQAAFNSWLNMLETQGIYTLNPVSTIKQNHNKFYLQQLQRQGVSIIPTFFIGKTDSLNLAAMQKEGWQKAIIKPAVSAGAHLTKLFNMAELPAIEKEYAPVAAQHDLLVQPYIEEINTVGEISLLFFNRQYSHAVLKKPQTGDFRVQQHHGGITVTFTPNEAVIDSSSQILTHIPGQLLYARVDGILINGRFTLMELELIEPYLFFDYGTGSINQFVEEAVNLLANRS